LTMIISFLWVIFKFEVNDVPVCLLPSATTRIFVLNIYVQGECLRW
jgi:hypothetical protein